MRMFNLVSRSYLQVLLVVFILLGTQTLDLSTHCFAQSSVWTRKADMPTARNAHAVGTVNGKIYAVGGEQSLSKVLEEYNPVTDNWIKMTNMPTARGWLSCNSVNDKIYVIGGYSTAFSQSTAPIVEEFNPTTDTWTTRSPIPSARWGHGTGTVNGKIYVIGGAINWPVDNYYKKTEEYDPSTDTWVTKSSIPSRRWGLSCCVVNGKIYAIGGYYYGTVSTVEEYDPTTDSWTSKSPMPTARWGLTTATVNGKIYAIGGGNVYPPTKSYKTVEEYDPITDTWTTKTPMPVGRIALAPASVSIDGKIYVIGGGGISASEAHAEVYVYDPMIETGVGNNIIHHSNFHLYQNYPNPFNPTTNIKFNLPKPEKVMIEIFNEIGQKVSVLVDETMPCGSHELKFSATNLPSGIYFYKLQAGEFSESRKFIVQK